MKTSGTAQLTNTLHSMMNSIAGAAAKPVLDFGQVQPDYSILLNTFRAPIPKDSYNVCRQMLYDPDEPLTITSEAGHHTHTHNVLLPKKMRWLKQGDKVLCAIIGNEVVVIDVVYDSHWAGDKEPNWT